MKSPTVHQTVIDPDGLTELEIAVQSAIARADALHIPWRVRARQGAAMILHPFGVHHWVRLRVFDPVSKQIIRTNDWTCALCPVVKP